MSADEGRWSKKKPKSCQRSLWMFPNDKKIIAKILTRIKKSNPDALQGF